MLLPDNVHPELSIYYNGAIVIRNLKKKKYLPVIELFELVKADNDMSFYTFILSLDWLYIIDAVKVDISGVVKLCL
jgi:hypothetical protein